MTYKDQQPLHGGFPSFYHGGVIYLCFAHVDVKDVEICFFDWKSIYKGKLRAKVHRMEPSTLVESLHDANTTLRPGNFHDSVMFGVRG